MVNVGGDTGLGNIGGAASSSLTLAESNSSALVAEVDAAGGVGGSGVHLGYSGSTASGNIPGLTGGAAQADAFLTTAHSLSVTVSATALAESGIILSASATAFAFAPDVALNTKSLASVGSVVPSRTNSAGIQAAAFLTASPTAIDSLTALTNHPHLSDSVNAGQGNGEVDITALETSLLGRVQLIVRKDLHLTWPRGETPTHWIAMGIDKDLTQATKIAVREAINFLVTMKGMTRDDAYMLTSVACDVEVTELVDGTLGVHVMIPKSIFTK